jgi:hypothetical protein
MPFVKGDVRINKTGRPVGSQNKTPNREKAVLLTNKIIQDLSLNYDKLTTEEKIKLLQVFKKLFDFNTHIETIQIQ